MLKNIVPRCDRSYTFCDTNGEFTLYPMSVNSQRQIVFWNVNTKASVNYTLNEFEYLYKNYLIREKKIRPSFLKNKNLFNSKKLYAVARGRLDFFITDKKYYATPLYWDFDGACYGEFDNFIDALNFLNEIDVRSPESARFVESSLTDNEMKIIEYYRALPKEEKKKFRASLFGDID